MGRYIESKKRVPSKLKTPLARSFGFDYGDLQDNQHGFISHWQKKRLRWHLMSYTISILIWILMMTFIPLAFIPSFDLAGLTAFPALIVACVVTVFGMFWFWKMRSVMADMRNGKVAELVSDVRQVKNYRTHRVRRGDETFEHNEHDHYIYIGSEQFSVTKDQMDSFREGVLYQIYVAPHSRQILSATCINPQQTDDAIDFLFAQSSVSLDSLYDDMIQTQEKGKNQS